MEVLHERMEVLHGWLDTFPEQLCVGGGGGASWNSATLPTHPCHPPSEKGEGGPLTAQQHVVPLTFFFAFSRMGSTRLSSRLSRKP